MCDLVHTKAKTLEEDESIQNFNSDSDSENVKKMNKKNEIWQNTKKLQMNDNFKKEYHIMNNNLILINDDLSLLEKTIPDAQIKNSQINNYNNI